MFDKIKRVKQIKKIFKDSVVDLKKTETTEGVNEQIGNLKKEIEKIVKGISKEISETSKKNSDTYSNLNYFLKHEFDSSKETGGADFTKLITTWRFNKKTLLNPISSIFLAKKEIIVWGKTLDKAFIRAENTKKKEKYESAKLLKEEKQLKKLSKKGLSEEEQKELDELLS